MKKLNFFFLILCTISLHGMKRQGDELPQKNAKAAKVAYTRQMAQADLRRAIKDNNPELADRALRNGARYTTTNHRGLYPIHRAVLNNACRVIPVLLHHGDNIERKVSDDLEQTSLLVAAEIGNQAAAACLIEAGSNVRASDKHGANALHHAARANSSALIPFLIEKRVPLERRTVYGDTPLLEMPSDHTENQEDTERFQAFMDNRANLQARNTIGDTLLHKAASENRIGLIQLCLVHGIKINDKNRMHSTPLHKAADNLALDAGKLLVAKGADVTTFNSNNHSPLQLVAGAEDEESLLLSVPFAAMLLEAGAHCPENLRNRTVIQRAKQMLQEKYIPALRHPHVQKKRTSKSPSEQHPLWQKALKISTINPWIFEEDPS